MIGQRRLQFAAHALIVGGIGPIDPALREFAISGKTLGSESKECFGSQQDPSATKAPKPEISYVVRLDNPGSLVLRLVHRALFPHATKIGSSVPFERLPTRDPRTVARDIPGVLDALFPRLTGGLVNSLNARMFSFAGISPVLPAQIENSLVQKAMIFEISMARAESELRDGRAASWESCLDVASKRQRRHFDARIPERLEAADIVLADHAARNLTAMLQSVQAQRSPANLEHAPPIPGLGWVASGTGDFAIGSTLIEVKHTAHNFSAGDFRQVLMYWLLRYAQAIEIDCDVWSEILMLNPRRNTALLLGYDYLVRSASGSSNRVELVELLRSAVGQELDRR